MKGLIFAGYVISEVENKEIWKLEKKDPVVNFQEKLEEIKNNKNISREEKEKILGIIKESFGGDSSPIREQINKLI
ncbi:MAG: hypothetical protein mread185_000643 [Mycoplasmataceae bacterium]|nr:MAG: hypothetical protein mread185_000643 [Mycoplasmataceae bacterium]